MRPSLKSTFGPRSASTAILLALDIFGATTTTMQPCKCKDTTRACLRRLSSRPSIQLRHVQPPSLALPPALAFVAPWRARFEHAERVGYPIGVRQWCQVVRSFRW